MGIMKKFEMLNVICKDCELTAKEKLVAQYFVYKSNQAGACYPCVDKIAEHCSVSRRTVQRATKKLAEKEYIIKEKRFKLGRQTSNLYSFNTLLLVEMQREKEYGEEREIHIQNEQMEVVEFEELLQIKEIDCETVSKEEILEEQYEEALDLDDLAASSMESDLTWENDFVMPFVDELAEVPDEETKQKTIYYSVLMKVFYSMCACSGKAEARSVAMIVVDKVICGNVVYLMRWKNRASIKIMGAFFPP